MNNLCLVVVLSLAASVAAAVSSSCASIDPKTRRDCGYPGISAADCIKNTNCCYDDSIYGVKWCFLDTTKVGTSACDSVDPKARKDCGYPGISAADCIKNTSCCYDDSIDGVKWCFFADRCQNMLVQQHVDPSIFFDRTWDEFKAGFGDTSGNYWLGNEQLHTLTQDNKYKLRFEVQSRASGLWYWAEYDTFIVGDESTQYTLTVAGFNGSVGYDAVTQWHNLNGMKFSTKDRDNDGDWGNCAQSDGGGFWYADCYYCMVNGAGDYFHWYNMGSDSDWLLSASRMWLVCR